MQFGLPTNKTRRFSGGVVCCVVVWTGLLLGMVNVLTFPSRRVFAFRLPFGDNSTGLGVAIHYLRVFLITFCHLVIYLSCGPRAHVG
jgi:hypothetical protein